MYGGFMTNKLVIIQEDPIPGKRLGRHVNHDPRSRNFAVTAAPIAKLKSVEHKRHVPPFDQGNLGSCVANSTAGILSTSPFRKKYTEDNAVDFYKQITAMDDISGAYPPDDTGSDGLSAAKWAKDKKLCRGYLHAFSLEAALTALQKDPIMIGISWLTGCDNPDVDGLIHYTGRSRGGHEIEVVGINVKKKLIKLSNSWGTGWGVGGYFFMSWDDLGKALDDGGDATVLLK
jgi:hypothetical protein